MPATTPHELPTPHAQILIVDTDPARTALSEAVSRLGHTVCHAAEPGPQVFDLPPGANPDLALIGLEAEGSEDALETARQVASRLDVPIVYVTETTDAGLLERARRTRPHGYLLRRADPRQLDLTIRGALGAAARDRSGARAAWNSAVLQGLFDRLSDAVIVADVRGRFVAMNAAARAIGPYDPARPEVWPDRHAIYQADGETPFAPHELPLTGAIRGKSTGGAVLRLRPLRPEAGSEDIWLVASGYPLRDASGRCIGGAVVMRNVTSASQEAARARTIEAELHERVQVLDAIIRSMGDGVVVTDAQLRITLANPSAKRIIGNDVPDHIPDEWADDSGLFYLDRTTRVPAEEMPSVRAVRGETIEDLVLFVRSPGIPEGVYISVNASPLRDEARRIAGSVAVFRDVSERKMQEEALFQAFAHGRLEVIDTLQHNIGNAINSVATGVDTLHGWLEDNELVRRFDALAGLVREHERDWIDWLAHDDQGRRIRPFLLALISDLTREQRSLWRTSTRVRERVRHIVDIIRAQAAFTNGAVERKTIDLAQTLADAVTVVQEGLGRRGVEIEVDCSRAPGELLVQEGRFQQLLVNLLVNALEATDERAARLGTDGWRPRVRLSAYRSSEEGRLTIDVIDNGIGLEASQLPSVFAAGYTTKKDGTGLGLHSAANFVIGSGGSIQPLSDGIGAGTTMRVTLRLSEPSPKEPASD